MQGDFYTRGANGDQGLQPFSMAKVIDEKPEYVAFNGSVGSTVSDKAITANVGETVRLFVGDGGPNLVSSFHVIGQIFDTVWPEGNLSAPTYNVQTTLIPAGGAAIVQFKVSVPGTFIIVDHSIERAFNRGALAQLKVTGPEERLVYSGKQFDLVYQPEGTGIRVAGQGAQAPAARTKAERIQIGAGIFADNCQACHQSNGEGVPDAFPPLAKSDYLNGDKIRAIKTVTGGLETKLTVNGHDFNGVMPAWSLSDEEIADVLTYVYNTWGNSGFEVMPEEVRAHRIQAKP
jgi:nitrite reductase (NO-forming)